MGVAEADAIQVGMAVQGNRKLESLEVWVMEAAIRCFLSDQDGPEQEAMDGRFSGDVFCGGA